MASNIQLNWIKDYRANQNQHFGDKVRYYKDGSGSQFINFDFMSGGQEITVAIRVEF